MKAVGGSPGGGDGTPDGCGKGEAVDTEIFSEQVQIERKIFSFELRENPRGRFLKVTEDVGGRRDTIIIPETGLAQIRDLLDRAVSASNKAGPLEGAGA